MYLEKELSEIVSIPSITSNITESDRCIDYCIDFIKNNTSTNPFILKKYFNNFPSILIANKETMLYDVLAICHIDVVPAKQEMFIPKIINNRMYGRGTADMKCGVLVALDILKDIINTNKQISFGVLIVSDEEIGGENGAKKWAELGLNGKILLDYDTGKGFGFITQKSKGAICLDVEAVGIESHGSMPWDGLDANDILFELITELRKTFKAYSINNKPDNTWVSTMHVGKISGGDAVNKISSNSKALIDIRYTEEYNSKNIINIFDNFKNKHQDHFSYKIIAFGKNVVTNIDNKYFNRYINCFKNETGKDPTMDYFNGTTDIRYFINDNNISIHHSPDIGPIHSEDEFVDLITLKKLKDIGLAFVSGL